MSGAKTEASAGYPPRPPPTVFRAYDIRGIAGAELNADGVEQIARAIGEEAQSAGIDTLLVGRDGRLSSAGLGAALIRGLRGSGCNVLDLGMVPTPLLYFAAHFGLGPGGLGPGGVGPGDLAADSGVILTASHNPAEYNGLKIMFHRQSLTEAQIQNIRRRVESLQPNERSHKPNKSPQPVEIYKPEPSACREPSADNKQQGLQPTDKSPSGRLQNHSIAAHYIRHITRDIRLACSLKVVIDGGNAVAGPLALDLFNALGCQAIPLFCEIDGSFPNHPPDPTQPANLRQLSAAVTEHGAHLGLAFDGDGDRLGAVDECGQVIAMEQLLAVLLRPLAPRYPGAPVVFDVKCSRGLARFIADQGMQPVMHRSGHSFMKQKMRESGAPIGGEFAAHIFIKDRWFGFDDGLYAAARLLEAFSQQEAPASVFFDLLPPAIATSELVLPVAEHSKQPLMERIMAEAARLGPSLAQEQPAPSAQHAPQHEARLITIDGLRAEFPDGWGLIRASNTSPALLLRFEGDTLQARQQIQDRFIALLDRADQTLARHLRQGLQQQTESSQLSSREKKPPCR